MTIQQVTNDGRKDAAQQVSDASAGGEGGEINSQELHQCSKELYE